MPLAFGRGAGPSGGGLFVGTHIVGIELPNVMPHPGCPLVGLFPRPPTLLNRAAELKFRRSGGIYRKYVRQCCWS